MRGFLIGLILIPGIVVGILSLRPGGLRQQLRNMARRLKLALVLVGVYLVASGVIRVAFPGNSTAEFATAGLAIALAAVFVFVGQDRQFQP